MISELYGCNLPLTVHTHATGLQPKKTKQKQAAQWEWMYPNLQQILN